MKTERLIGIDWDIENALNHCNFAKAESRASEFGKRIPTKEEWDRLLQLPHYWSYRRKGMVFGKHRWQLWKRGLYLPASGFIHASSCSLFMVGILGSFWSSTEGDADCMRCVDFTRNRAGIENCHVINGVSLRLVRDIQ